MAERYTVVAKQGERRTTWYVVDGLVVKGTTPAVVATFTSVDGHTREDAYREAARRNHPPSKRRHKSQT